MLYSLLANQQIIYKVSKRNTGYCLIVLAAILLMVKAKAQVYNGSFEVASCPDFIGNLPDGWHNVRNDADLLSTCDISDTSDFSCVGVPCNWFGCQQPQDGNNYISLCLGGENNTREWIKGGIEPMLKDEVYLITFYYSRSDRYNLAVNNIGCYFGDLTYQFSYFTDFGVIDNSKLIYQQYMLVDTANWYLFSQYYVAKGGENSITIGNFYSDAFTKYENYGTDSEFDYAYYYIDNVKVERVVTTDINELPVIKPKPKINYNVLGQQLW